MGKPLTSAAMATPCVWDVRSILILGLFGTHRAEDWICSPMTKKC